MQLSKNRFPVWSWFRYVLTDKNDNWDLSILFWFGAILIFLTKSVQVPAISFDFLNFGVGCVGIFGAGKALEWLTERHNKEPAVTKTEVTKDTVVVTQTESTEKPKNGGH